MYYNFSLPFDRTLTLGNTSIPSQARICIPNSWEDLLRHEIYEVTYLLRPDVDFVEEESSSIT